MMHIRTWMRAGVAGAIVATAVAAIPASAQSAKSIDARIAVLEKRATLLEDRAQIENLTRAYGYYIDKKVWGEVVPLFSKNAVVEISGRGVYKGAKGVDTLFTKVIGRNHLGLADGELSNHMVLQGVTNVAPDGKTATGRWRAFIQIGMWQKMGLWAEGTYDIGYVKENGVWKFSMMRWYGTYFTPYDKGWAQSSFGNNGPSKDFPPDAPQSAPYDAYPGHYVPPFPYPNPVTGRPWTQADTDRYSTKGMDPSAAANSSSAGSPLSLENQRQPQPAPAQPPR
ncbi:MAG: nuclear transport factor 2 family protein [Candidatus Sphingomonas colombiensis]|nr:nuclear transport factor 2 family protein [Sphingomonas sp.]WEK43966.1 MAG: nuclear transport factor 2 family protein [Sphingomonas sp.]